MKINPVHLEPLEPRRLLTGVTIVTHGFNSGVGDWVTAMGNAIASQSGALATQPRYQMTVTDEGATGGPLTVSSTRLGPDPAHWGSTEIVILLDWSYVAGSLPPDGTQRSTADVGSAVADALLGTAAFPDLSTPLAQLPLHLIGHSRGAGLVSEIARGLGQRGVWVDQLTYLDPHPVDGNNDLGFNFSDTPMRVYDNVRFAEDYWRKDDFNPFDFDGEAVNGAYNLQLSETILSSGGGSIEHSDVHLWYHGTIGPPFADSDGGGTSVGPNWYNAPQGPRDQLGWKFSRTARGSRPPAGLKTSAAHRDAVALTVSGASVWDDVSIDNLTSDSAVAQGTSLAVVATFEDRSVVGTRDSTITFGFDRDDNPYNGVFGAGVSFVTSSLASDSLDAALPTTNIAGAFRVYAKISNGVSTRYYYAPGRAIVTVPGFDKTWTGPASGDWSTASNWTPTGVPTSAQSAALYDSAVTLTATTKIAALKIGGTGSLDLGTHNLVIDYPDESPLGTWNGGAYEGIAGLIAAGKIRSAVDTSSLYAIGSAESSQVLNIGGVQTKTWQGQTVDATSVLVHFTYGGDANLDGAINIDDYGHIDTSVGLGLTGWFNGDFNYDGVINIDDYGIIDANVGVQGIPL